MRNMFWSWLSVMMGLSQTLRLVQDQTDLPVRDNCIMALDSNRNLIFTNDLTAWGLFYF